MIVHGSPVSPFVRKVIVFAAEKGLHVENKPIGLGPKTPEFMAISPFGKIPGFEDGEYKLSDSTAIVQYLDIAYPDHNLIPTEAKARGRTIWFDEFADTIVMPAYGPIFFNRVIAPLLGMPADPALADKAEAEAVPPVLAYIESQIPQSGFLVEDRLTLADISIMGVLAVAPFAQSPIDPAHYPKTAAYVGTIGARPAFAAAVEGAAKTLRPQT